MTKHIVGNVDSFCSKLDQISLKGLAKIPCEHKCHIKYGSVSRADHERSWKVTRIKNSFSGMRHMFIVTFARRIQKSRPFCNLIPCKPTTEMSGSHNVKFSICFFFRIKLYASEPVWSQDSKSAIFISVRCLEMLKIAIWKMTSSTDTAFALYVCQKIDISTWNLACQMSRHGSITYCTFKKWKFWIW